MQKYIKKILGSGTTILIISNDEMKDIIRIVKSFEKGGYVIGYIKCKFTRKYFSR